MKAITKSHLRTGTLFLTIMTIGYGLNKCNDKLTKSIDVTQTVNKFAIQSLTDSFKIKLNKPDSILFENYIKEFTSKPFVKERIYDLYKIGRDTNLLSSPFYNKKKRDKVLRDIVEPMLISTGGGSKLDSMNQLLSTRLEKYSEYQRFKTHWETTIAKEGYGKLFSKKYIPKKEMSKSSLEKLKLEWCKANNRDAVKKQQAVEAARKKFKPKSKATYKPRHQLK